MDNTPTSDQPGVPETARPGDTISPASAAAPPPEVAPSPSPAPEPASLPPADPRPTPPARAETTAVSPLSAQPERHKSEDDAIRWTAAEFIAHNKSVAWYGLLALAVIVLAVIVFLLTRDKISTSVVIIAGIALGGYGARQPQQRQYALDDQGLSIGDKYLPYSLFRSFSVIDEGPVSSISFFPLKRFGQLTTIYYNPDDEADIIDLLADRLPMDERGHDAVDKLMRRIRF